MQTDDLLVKSLLELCQRIKEYVITGLQRQELEFNMEIETTEEVEDFSYSRVGITSGPIRGENTWVLKWDEAIQKVLPSVKKSDEYSKCFKLISDNFTVKQSVDWVLERFCRAISEVTFENQNNSVTKLYKEKTQLFVNDLKQSPIFSIIKVELLGIVLESHHVQLSDEYLLRQTTKGDVNRKYRYVLPRSPYPLIFPTAILEISIWSIPEEENDIHVRILRIICLLRLFCSGGIALACYTSKSNSIYRFATMGIISPNGHILPPFKTHFLTKNSNLRLKQFFSDFPMPEDVYSYKIKDTPIAISFERYTEAIDHGIFEKRITYAAMGLEALFIDENTEISYRLRMRVAKLMCYFNLEFAFVKKVINESYLIRSKYSHGGILSNKDKKRIKREFGEDALLLTNLLEILRISLVVFIFIDQSKIKFIESLEEAMIMKTKEIELSKGLRHVRKYIKVES